jgi:hypothetical protein
MARQGAEIDYEEAEYAAPRPECILYEWAKEGTLSQQQWGPQIKKHIKQVMGQQAWEARVSVKTTEGSVDEFMNRGNSGREILVTRTGSSQLLGLGGEGLDLSFVTI